jgi:hypothetical protein
MDWNALLPESGHPSYARIHAIVSDLQRDYSHWIDKVREFELAATSSSAGEPSAVAEVLQREVQALAVDIESYVAEINYLGVKLNVQDLFEEIP